MKKIFTYLAAIFIITLSLSCSEDPEDLIGVWDIYYLDIKNCDDPTDNLFLDLTNNRCITENGLEICFDITYDFKSDGTLTLNTFSESLGIERTETQIFSYTIDGDKISACDSSGCDTISFDLSGDEVTFEWTDDEYNCEYFVRGRK